MDSLPVQSLLLESLVETTLALAHEAAQYRHRRKWQGHQMV
jgi:hypothetical protein